jgi:DNA-directed RNA polymerase specialized sigma24 family protein
LPEERRAQAVNALSEPGQQRIQLNADLLALDQRLRPLVIRAAVAGVPYRRIAELTGISHATVARWLKDAGALDL